MANSKQATKRARQNNKRRIHNMALRSKMRTFMKRVTAAADAGDADGAKAAMKQAEPIIDAMVNKGIVHKNKAARQKSRLTARIKSL